MVFLIIIFFLLVILSSIAFDIVVLPVPGFPYSINPCGILHPSLLYFSVLFKTSTILGYELIWNNLSFDTTTFVELEEENLDSKSEALLEYKSQGKRHYMKKEFVYALAQMRGVQIGLPYAESFEVIRWVIK